MWLAGRALVKALLLGAFLIGSISNVIAQPGPGPVPPQWLLTQQNTWLPHQQFNALDVLARIAPTARLNNPRINPVMASPPTITDNSSHDGSLSVTYNWTGSNNGVFNFYGGNPTTDGVGFAKFPSTTISGTRVQAIWRVETLVDASTVEYKILNISGGTINFIVDGQYVSNTVVTLGSGIRYVKLAFATRTIRTVTIEANGVDFGEISVSAVSTLQQPSGPIVRFAMVGDSFFGGGGSSPYFVNMAQIIPDLLGAKDIWNLGVGSTGILANASGTQLTCPGRLSDLVNAAPSDPKIRYVIMLSCGHNDTGANLTNLTAATTAWLVAIRAQTTLKNVPIIFGSMWGNLALATAKTTETAIKLGVTNFIASTNDKLIFFRDDANNLAGPIVTGLGCIGATTGAGNADLLINIDCVHPNQSNYGAYPEGGHWLYANEWANWIMKNAAVQ